MKVGDKVEYTGKMKIDYAECTPKKSIPYTISDVCRAWIGPLNNRQEIVGICIEEINITNISIGDKNTVYHSEDFVILEEFTKIEEFIEENSLELVEK